MHARSILQTLPVDRILTWSDQLVGECDWAVKCNIGQPLIRPSTVPCVPFGRKKFCAAVYSNKMIGGEILYAVRRNVIEYFARKSMCDIYGIGWAKTNIAILKASYLGEIPDKISTLKNYRYCICFENYTAAGLITERFLMLLRQALCPFTMVRQIFKIYPKLFYRFS